MRGFSVPFTGFGHRVQGRSYLGPDLRHLSLLGLSNELLSDFVRSSACLGSTVRCSKPNRQIRTNGNDKSMGSRKSIDVKWSERVRKLVICGTIPTRTYEGYTEGWMSVSSTFVINWVWQKGDPTGTNCIDRLLLHSDLRMCLVRSLSRLLHHRHKNVDLPAPQASSNYPLLNKL